MSGKSKTNPLIDFAAGGISGAVSKTITAPIERVKLIIQTQDANPKIISGEVPRYTGIGNCFVRVRAEQGMGAFWRGNFTNCIRYFPTQALNLASKDSIKGMFPKYNPKTEFWPFFGTNLASGGLAGGFSLCFVYPLDYARTRLASDVGSGKKTFTGLGDCLAKTAKGPKGVLSLYNGFGISVAGIIPYRGTQFGLNDTLLGLNPFAKEVSFVGIASKWACAQFSVIASGFVTYPFDTVRRRL
jgi:solute carrier family 25 (adenine nucleotide translocator) protein 4/5/6/31